MELKQVLSIIRKNLILILIISFLTAAGTLIFLHLKPLTYRVFFAINVSQTGLDETTDYQYDNYYSGLAIDNFTDSLERWFDDPQLISSVLGRSGLKPDDLSAFQQSSLIKGRKKAPRYLEVSFNANSEAAGRQVFTNLSALLEERVAGLRDAQPVWFKLNIQEPLITLNQWNPYLAVIIAFIAGFMLGIFIALFRHYLKTAPAH